MAMLSEAQDILLNVPDMSCEHCVNTIDTTLNGLQGVENVSADLSTKTVRLRYQPTSVSLPQIEAVLEEAGYTVAK
jgi:copper chaperone